jgi:cytochrome c2
VTRRLRAAFALVSGFAITGCDLSHSAPLPNRQVADGDVARGRAIVTSGAHGCTGCHDVPGILMPKGVVGPRLDDMRRRSFIAGTLPNRPDVLVAFLQDPPALVPATGMPNVRLSPQDARDIAAFLYTLEPTRGQ